MVRPRISLTPEQVREVETLAALLNQDQIADYFGIVRNTFRAICERDQEVLARYKKGKGLDVGHSVYDPAADLQVWRTFLGPTPAFMGLKAAQLFW